MNINLHQYSLPQQRIFEQFPSVTQRYFEPRFYRPKNKSTSHHNSITSNHDQCVLTHSNKVCLITLSPQHDILRLNKVISSIDFQISDSTNRLENKVSGKWKRGGQRVEPDSVLCRIKCGSDQDNEYYNVYACIKGTIVEVNEKLMSNFGLLSSHPFSNGYIAIIQPFIRGQGGHQAAPKTAQQKEKDPLFSKEEYHTLLNTDISSLNTDDVSSLDTDVSSLNTDDVSSHSFPSIDTEQKESVKRIKT